MKGHGISRAENWSLVPVLKPLRIISPAWRTIMLEDRKCKPTC